jgi:pre-mRNA-splicing factor SPF27
MYVLFVIILTVDYDAALTDEQQDQIDELLNPLIPATDKEHPFVASLSRIPEPPSFWAAEYERISQNKPLTGIDLERYQLSNDVKANLVAAEYLASRTDNLALLETYGTNAWLIGNAIQSHALGVLEQELAELKEEAVRVNRERKHAHLEVGGQIDKLNQRWRKAIRGIVEVEIACAGLEDEIQTAKRQKRHR